MQKLPHAEVFLSLAEIFRLLFCIKDLVEKLDFCKQKNASDREV